MEDRLMVVFFITIALSLVILAGWVFLPEMVESGIRKIVRIVYDERDKMKRGF